ncbi:MAG: molybdate ABC transporter permease subunit [Aeromicrobium sp.]|nr:MAG: molybdate ABC transporter permease subunit [Aeromicrobium sp.]
MGLATDWANFLGLITSESSRAALLLSIKTATASTVVCLVLGVPLALVLSRSGSRFLNALRPLLLLPLVLPPVVGGMALLATFGRRGLIGQHLEALGVSIAFSTIAVVMAQVFVSLPFLVLTLEGALRSAGQQFENIAATLGASPTIVLFRVTLPLVLPGLAAGAILSFARALGEFGATITFAGSLQGITRTLPLEIYLQREVDPNAAIALSMLLVVLAAFVMYTVHRSQGVRE